MGSNVRLSECIEYIEHMDGPECLGTTDLVMVATERRPRLEANLLAHMESTTLRHEQRFILNHRSSRKTCPMYNADYN
jgi:hypothetical protein